MKKFQATVCLLTPGRPVIIILLPSSSLEPRLVMIGRAQIVSSPVETNTIRAKTRILNRSIV